MLITRTITKKLLENIVYTTFSNFGNLSCSSLLDSLKLLGFYYATNAGISINIEDLKTPNVKKNFIKIATEEMVQVSEQWQQGFISDTERFQSIIDSWNIATEGLKNRIIDYYENFDPANNLYIMAFSGARGNMSQVRQLVGMRGLMSDQEGKIIDLPIQSNFREGLSSIDYIISSYGARKGIVDTALKTADSGYLTRRLIYIAQDLVIREYNCKSKKGIIILLDENTSVKNILGRVILSAKKSISPYNLVPFSSTKIFEENNLLTENNLKFLKTLAPLTLNIRSPLTCNSNGSICQKCYGWDLGNNKLISLGEAVGIIAAQSIGEPGTQLTMRTFHTGGIFTSETVKQILAPFSGKIIIPNDLKTLIYRTSHGLLVSKLQQEIVIKLINWKGKEKEIFLEVGSFLYIKSSTFIKKDQLICEYSTQSIIPGARRLKPIYATTAGEVKVENLAILNRYRDKRTIKITQDDGIISLAAGKIFPLPKEIKYKFRKKLNKNKAFATLKIITPYEGIVIANTISFSIINMDQKFSIAFSSLRKEFRNSISKFSFLLKNYQYVDKYSLIGFLDIFPKYNGEIYAIRRKLSKTITNLFLITETDVWKIHSDQVNNFSFFENKKTLIRSGNLLNNNTKLYQSGFFLKKDGLKLIFQNAIPIFLSSGTIINYKKGDLVFENQLFATLVNYTQQTEDIVQGLPKIEELIEARKPKIKSFLSARAGIFLNSNSLIYKTFFKNNIINCKGKNSEELKKREKVKDKIFAQIIHSLYLRDEIVVYNEDIVKVTPIPKTFEPFEKAENKKIDEYGVKSKNKKTDEYLFKNKQNELLLLNGKNTNATWVLSKPENIDNILYKYHQNKLIEWKILDNSIIFRNKKLASNLYFIVKTITNEYLLLEYLNPVTIYQFPNNVKLIGKPGFFIDIGEPITEGSIDIHELLTIFFKHHSTLDGIMVGLLRSLNKFQLILVNSVQAIYQSQNVNISSKHIEIIVRQMTSKIVITESGDTPLLHGEIIRLSLIKEIYNSLKENQVKKNYKTPKFEPLLLSTTNSSLSKDGFLSAAGFQETKRVLTKSAIEGTADWLRGLKECVIIGRLVPAGSAFLNYKNYLDNIYLFKD
jgi:hypothetical protein